jgi:hypothetical protein
MEGMEKQRMILFVMFCIAAISWLVYRISVEGIQINPRYTFEEQYKYK